jgi:hypothetical protein
LPGDVSARQKAGDVFVRKKGDVFIRKKRRKGDVFVRKKNERQPSRGSRNGVRSRDREQPVRRKHGADHTAWGGPPDEEDTRASCHTLGPAAGRRQADITKLLNGLVTGYSSDVQNVHSREAVVILEEIHDARFGPPGRTTPSPATCSTAAW